MLFVNICMANTNKTSFSQERRKSVHKNSFTSARLKLSEIWMQASTNTCRIPGYIEQWMSEWLHFLIIRWCCPVHIYYTLPKLVHLVFEKNLKETTGEIISPGYKSVAPAYDVFAWHMTADPKYIIKIQITSIHMPVAEQVLAFWNYDTNVLCTWVWRIGRIRILEDFVYAEMHFRTSPYSNAMFSHTSSM